MRKWERRTFIHKLLTISKNLKFGHKLEWNEPEIDFQVSRNNWMNNWFHLRLCRILYLVVNWFSESFKINYELLNSNMLQPPPIFVYWNFCFVLSQVFKNLLKKGPTSLIFFVKRWQHAIAIKRIPKSHKFSIPLYDQIK